MLKRRLIDSEKEVGSSTLEVTIAKSVVAGNYKVVSPTAAAVGLPLEAMTYVLVYATEGVLELTM